MMNRFSLAMKGAVLAAVVVLAGPAVNADGAESDTVELTISNFRYCATPTCTPGDQGYVRAGESPMPGSDNPRAIVDVPQGSTVRWVYRDVGPGSCDFFEQCPGHNVRFEDGTTEGTSVGGVRSRSGNPVITTTITQGAGELIRYFCSINDHYQLGMTGLLRVTGAAG